MFGNRQNVKQERDVQRMKQAALQTKGQKRWRAKGTHLQALLLGEEPYSEGLFQELDIQEP